MRTYILRRGIAIPVIIFVVSLIVFIFLRALPGDAADVKCGASGQADQTCADLHAPIEWHPDRNS